MSPLMILDFISFMALGIATGWVYFNAIWWSASLLAGGNRTGLTVALVMGRFALIAAVLATVAIRGGAMPLLATALGITAARMVFMRRVRAMTP
jgi:uncharacterized membrane protein (UPF0136 family)